MRTQANEHTISKHGDYVRRTHRGGHIVVQYRDDCEDHSWCDLLALEDHRFEESTHHAKRMQISQERKLNVRLGEQ